MTSNKIIFLIYCLFFIVGLILYGYMHEQVHVKIFDDYNIYSKVEYFKSFPHIVTIPDNKTYYKCGESCLLAHEINESIGYNFMAVYLIVGLGIIMLTAIIINIFENE